MPDLRESLRVQSGNVVYKIIFKKKPFVYVLCLRFQSRIRDVKE